MFSQSTCRSSVNGQPSATIEYVYDGNGNRYSKTITLSGGTANTRYYSYDTGGNIVSEYKRVILNGSEESQTLVRYVRDTSGKAISMIQGANTYYFTYNGHGDVTALTDSTGTVAATYSYDEFGNQTSSTGNIYNPLRYSGANNAYYDSETALYKMGTRYYQPDIARWLTRDSFGGLNDVPNANNKYLYVTNNPLTNIDPSGHVAVDSKEYAKSTASLRSAYIKVLRSYKGVPFEMGGEYYPNNKPPYDTKKYGRPVGGRNSIDCIGLARHGLEHVFKKRFPDMLANDYATSDATNHQPAKGSGLWPGDPVFYSLFGDAGYTHTIVYAGKKRWIWASYTRGEVIETKQGSQDWKELRSKMSESTNQRPNPRYRRWNWNSLKDFKS